MSNTDINLQPPSQNPQDPKPLLAPTVKAQAPKPLLAPTVQAQGIDPAGAAFTARRKARRQKEKETQDRFLIQNLRSAAAGNPDLAAHALELGIDLGIGSVIAGEDLEAARELQSHRKHNAFFESGGNPILMRALLDPEFANIAHDDLENLATYEQQWEAGELGSEISDLEFKRMTTGGKFTPEDLITRRKLEKRMRELPVDTSGMGVFHGVGQGTTRMVAGMWDTALTSAVAGGTAAALTGLATAWVPAAVPFTASTAGSKVALITLGILSGQRIAGDAYGSLRDAGFSHEVAKDKAESIGYIGGVLEAGGFGLGAGNLFAKVLQRQMMSAAAKKALKTATRSEAGRRLLLGWVRSAGPEIMVEVAQDLTQWGFTGLAHKQTGKKDDRPDLDVMPTIMETLRGVAVLSAFGPAIQFKQNMAKAKRGVATGEFLENFGKAVNDSKVQKRAPSRFHEFLAQAVEGSTGPKSLFFDLDVFTQAMDESGFTMADLEKISPEVAAAVKSAEVQEFGDVEIPTHSFGAQFLTSSLGQALTPHARTEAGGKSAAEGLMIQKNAEELTKHGVALMADSERVNAQDREELGLARKRIERQLIAAGQTPDEAAVEATLQMHIIAVMADQEGMTPSEWEAAQALTYTTEEALDEAREGEDVPIERAAVGDTVTVYDPAGKPRKAIVTAVSEVGGMPLVRLEGETEEIILGGIDSEWGRHDPSSPDYAGWNSRLEFLWKVAPTIGLASSVGVGRRVNELTDVELDRAFEYVTEQLKKRKGGKELTDQSWQWMRDRNALRFEQKRREAALELENLGSRLPVKVREKIDSMPPVGREAPLLIDGAIRANFGDEVSDAARAYQKARETEAVADREGGTLEESLDAPAKRVLELQEAAQQLADGKLTKQEYEEKVNKFKPITPYEAVPEPATDGEITGALQSNKVEQVGASRSLAAGEKVALRLDIPAYNNHGIWVVSIHWSKKSTSSAPGKVVGYDSVARITNATMAIGQPGALKIAAGKAKAPLGVINGEWVPTTPEEAKAAMEEALVDPAWRQVGMDPERHGYFYDRKTLEPIVSADEVIQVGPLVMARGAVTAPKDEFLFQQGLDQLSKSELEDRHLAAAMPWSKKTDATIHDRRLPMMALAMEPEAASSTAINLGLFKQILYKGKRVYDSIVVRGRTSEEKAEVIIEQMVRNLETLFDKVAPAVRRRSRKWYDGANRIAYALADRYGLEVEQASAVLAVLSPQADWRMNVSYAERILDAMTERPAFTPKMGKWLNAYIKAMKEDTPKRVAHKKDARKIVKNVKGKSLDELTDPMEKAYWIRAYDQSHNDRPFRDLAPEGEMLGYVQTEPDPKTGKTSNVTLAWKSYKSIANAISVIENGSLENISARLGRKHKVRNFYHNILDPNTKVPYVTVDTHQNNANLLIPGGASTVEVNQSLASAGSSSNNATGLSGTYWIYHEAVVRAAKNKGVLPREMQSISWEAVRHLFSPNFKVRSEQKGTKEYYVVRDIWRKHHRGKLTYAQAIDQLFAAAGHADGQLSVPSWAGHRPGTGLAFEGGGASYTGAIPDAVVGSGKSRGTRGRGRPGKRKGRPGRGRSLDQLKLYSALERELEALPIKSATPDGWRQAIAGLVKKGKVKQEEIFWTGILDWLDAVEAIEKGTKIAKGQFQMAMHGKLVEVKRNQLGGQIPAKAAKVRNLEAESDRERTMRSQQVIGENDTFIGITPDGIDLVNYRGHRPHWTDEDHAAVTATLRANLDRAWESYTAVSSRSTRTEERNPTRSRYDTYTLRRGKNYREVMLKIPLTESTGFIHDHWPGHKNMVVHLRLADHTGPNGEKVLLVEEIQSDWGQEGRDQGFAVIADPEAYNDAVATRDAVQAKIDKLLDLHPSMLGRSPDNEFTLGELREERYRAERVLNALGPDSPGAPVGPFVSTEQTATMRAVKEKQQVVDEKTGKTNERSVVTGYEVYYGTEKKKGEKAKPFLHSRHKTKEQATAQVAELDALRKPIEHTKGWLNLGLKQAVIEAIEGGYDQIAFATGEQSAARYDMRKEIDHITTTARGQEHYLELSFWTHNGTQLSIQVDIGTETIEVAEDAVKQLEGKRLDQVVPKDLAKKILDNANRVMEHDAHGELDEQQYEGDDLKVGGEGLVEFYEKMVPSQLKKLFGKKGGKLSVVNYGKPLRKVADRPKHTELPSSWSVGPTEPGQRLHLERFSNENFVTIDQYDTEMTFGETEEEAVASALRYLNDSDRLLPPGWDAVEDNYGEWTVTDENGEPVSFETFSSSHAAIKDAMEKHDPLKEMGEQLTFEISDELKADIEEQGGATLFAGEQRGRYIPSENLAILTKSDIRGEGADPSTVLHEMMHHYVNVMLRLALQGKASKAMRKNIDAMFTFWKIPGATFEERLEYWDSLPFKAEEGVESQAQHHESLTYNYELWLFTGKAPTSALATLFAKIRDYMIGVYTSLTKAKRRLEGTYKANFGVDLPGLTPELGEMFMRLVASEEAAAHAENINELGPLFATRDDFIMAGGDAAQYDTYRFAMEEARQQMITELAVESFQAMQYQDRAQGKVLVAMQRLYKERRREVEKEVTEQVESSPIYLMMARMRANKIGLDRDLVYDLLAGLDEESMAMAKKKLKPFIRVSDGLPPDAAADLAGFETGQQLVGALVAALPIKEEITQRTDAAMEQRYGKPATPEEKHEQALRAVHNEARSKFAAVEWKFLAKSTKPWRVILGAAREAARKILAGRALNDMDPRKFGQLENRANAAARESMKTVKPRKAYTDKKGVDHEEVTGRGPDPEAAIGHRQRALLFNQLAYLALEAKAEVSKAKGGLFRKVARGAAPKIAEARDPDYVMAARTILAQYGLLPEGVIEKTADFMARMQVYLPDKFVLFEEELAMAQEAGQDVNFDHRNMTLDQFHVLQNQIKALWYLSKRENEIKVDGQRVKLANIVAEMMPTLIERKRKKIPGQVDGSKTTKASTFFSGIRVALTKIEHYMHNMDGGKQGPFTKYLFREVKEAVNAYRADATLHVKEFVDALDRLRDAGKLPSKRIDAPELGVDEQGRPVFTFGAKGSKAGGMVELIGALLHMGNESNKSKFLIAGRGLGTPGWATLNDDLSINYDNWNDLIERLVKEKVLTKEHFEFVQGVWDLMEKIKPKLQAAHVELEGYTFKEVKAQPFPIHFPGDKEPTLYPGGYVPAALDREAARASGQTAPAGMTLEQVEADNFRKGLPKVAGGMTMERAEGYRERPLTMNLNDIGAHIDASLRYAHVAPAIADMSRILEHQGFKTALAQADPDALDFLLVPFMRRAVTQTLYKSDGTPGTRMMGAVAKHLRQMTGISIMAFNWLNAGQQLTGLLNAMKYVDAHHMKAGLFEYLSRWGGLTDEIAGKSTFMDDRLRNQMFDLTEDMRSMVAADIGRGESTQTWFTKNAYFLQSKMQNAVDIVTWRGAYNQALQNAIEGETLMQMERRAVREADAAVRLSQGSFSAEDTAGYEEGSAWWRLGTQFTSYFNTVLNQYYYAEKGSKIRTGLITFVLPMIMAEAMANFFYDRWDDDDEDGYIDASVWGSLFIGSQIRGALSTMPIVGGNLVRAYELTWGDRPFGDQVVSSPMHATVMKSVIGIAKATMTVDPDKKMTDRILRDTMTAGVLFLPAGGAMLAPFLRPVSYAYGVGTGDTEPTSLLDTARGLMTGYASKDSRK